jgi:N-6 DNA Methylase
MPRRRNSDATPFETMRLEGALFVPELLERMAAGEASTQAEADYEIPKGLKLHEEYGRSFRIATALGNDFAQQALRADIDAAAATRTFVLAFMRECLAYKDAEILNAPIELGGRQFPVTAMSCARRVPLIIAPHRLGLDDPDAEFAIMGSGTRRKSAHQLAQEFLNASSDCLWAVVTNGRSIRLLRDAETLTRPGFLEFDLETILAEASDRYADFAALWRILHSSRASTATSAGGVWEKWKADGHAQGIRVRDGLRDGVTQALLILGSGFLSHPENKELRQRLQDGSLRRNVYFQQLLRLIYRWLFVFCAEERNLLHSPEASESVRAAYADGYSMKRLRRRSLRLSARDSHGDLWVSVRILFKSLGAGEVRLGLPSLGGLFAEDQCQDLDTASLSNRDLLAAMRELRWFFDRQSGRRSAIDYRNMGPEELGSVYESLLELVPTVDLEARKFGFVGITSEGSSAGNARKTTGSYYTHDSLVQQLIKTALDPVIQEKLAAHPDRPVEALLSISVCDPACGSGHFLLAAARRLAEKLAELRAPDGSVTNADYRHALRDVTSHCVYGVDINPMAVELCRVALWLETVDPGKPLGFLDHHIRCGNSLFGTTPEIIAAGLPDEAFTAVKARGDDSKVCSALKTRNKSEREGFGPLFAKENNDAREKMLQVAQAIEGMDDEDSRLVEQKKKAFSDSKASPEFLVSKFLADAWCAAFVSEKVSMIDPAADPREAAPIAVSEEGQLLHLQDELFAGDAAAADKGASKKPKKAGKMAALVASVSGVTTGTLRDIVEGRHVDNGISQKVKSLADKYGFFHWHLAFPQVYANGGFDCILGNPPWERVKLTEKEFFADKSPEIAAADKAGRNRLIKELKNEKSPIYLQFIEEKIRAASESSFFRNSNVCPLTGKGDVNLFALFTERCGDHVNKTGRVGVVVPTNLATDLNTSEFFSSLITRHSLESLYDFINSRWDSHVTQMEGGDDEDDSDTVESSLPMGRERLFFPGVLAQQRFSLITFAGSERMSAAPVFAAMLRDTQEISPGRIYTLSAEDIELVNPNTLSAAMFPSPKHASIVKGIYGRTPVLIRKGKVQANPWCARLRSQFHMSNDREDHFIDRKAFLASPSSGAASDLALVPLYEAKMLHQYDHRWASYPDAPVKKIEPSLLTHKQDPEYQVGPRYRVSQSTSDERHGPALKWFIGWRDIARATDERTTIATALPRVAFGNKVPLIDMPQIPPVLRLGWLACANSLVLDFVSRQKISAVTYNFYLMEQMPFPKPAEFLKPAPWTANEQAIQWIAPRVAELVFTSVDMRAFADDIQLDTQPFAWDPERRFLLRAEIDAAMLRLYQVSPKEAEMVLDSFPIIRARDVEAFGVFRTKETTMLVFEKLLEAERKQQRYGSILDSPPAGGWMPPPQVFETAI